MFTVESTTFHRKLRSQVVLAEDTQPLNGATAWLAGSHRWVAEHLRQHGEPLPSSLLGDALQASHDLAATCPIRHLSEPETNVFMEKHTF